MQAELRAHAEEEKMRKRDQDLSKEKLLGSSAKANQSVQPQQDRSQPQEFPPHQHPETYKKAKILVSHRKSNFPHTDRWVPREWNYRWKTLKEEFIKWFYVFSFLPHDKDSKRNA